MSGQLNLYAFTDERFDLSLYPLPPDDCHVLQMGDPGGCKVCVFATLDQVVEMRDKLTDYINTQAQTSEVAA